MVPYSSIATLILEWKQTNTIVISHHHDCREGHGTHAHTHTRTPHNNKKLMKEHSTITSDCILPPGESARVDANSLHHPLTRPPQTNKVTRTCERAAVRSAARTLPHTPGDMLWCTSCLLECTRVFSQLIVVKRGVLLFLEHTHNHRLLRWCPPLRRPGGGLEEEHPPRGRVHVLRPAAA